MGEEAYKERLTYGKINQYPMVRHDVLGMARMPKGRAGMRKLSENTGLRKRGIVMGSIDPSIIHNERFAKLMTPADRKREKVQTLSEAIDKADAKAETEIQGEIVKYLHLHDIIFIRPPMNKRSMLPPGWPDLTFCYRGAAVGAEAKTAIGKLSSDQVKCHEAMRSNGWRVAVVRSVSDVQKLFREIDAELSPPPAAIAQLMGKESRA